MSRHFPGKHLTSPPFKRSFKDPVDVVLQRLEKAENIFWNISYGKKPLRSLFSGRGEDAIYAVLAFAFAIDKMSKKMLVGFSLLSLHSTRV